LFLLASSVNPFYFNAKQREWCEKVLSGEKVIECRRYPPPPSATNMPMLLAATGGVEGIPTLGDRVEPGLELGEVLGWVVFKEECIKYITEHDFAADEQRHCVSRDSVYAWQPGEYVCRS
jgi:hypothetical protein